MDMAALDLYGMHGRVMNVCRNSGWMEYVIHNLTRCSMKESLLCLDTITTVAENLLRTHTTNIDGYNDLEQANEVGERRVVGPFASHRTVGMHARVQAVHGRPFAISRGIGKPMLPL